MTGSLSQGLRPAEGQHLVLYDGVCGLCSRLLRFIIEHDRRHAFAFASLQSEVGRALVERFGGDPGTLTTFRVVADYRTRQAEMFVRSRAILFVAGELGWPWKASAMFRILPAVILDPFYDAIARHRYRIFGRYDQCLIPDPDIRRRFVDWKESV